MNTRSLRAGSRRLDVTVLGFGGAPLGNLYAPLSDETATATLETARESGLGLYDTAPLYGHGLSEERFGGVLGTWPRDSFILSTKVGRLLRDCAPEEVPDVGFRDVPNRAIDFDYSYDGVMCSHEASLRRLGLERVDILLVHDVDAFTHGSRAASDARIREPA
jgi:D-threo-aldose 1-dehydrogenase